MTRSTKQAPSPGQILLEHLDQLRRRLESSCDAFDGLYQHVHHLQASHLAKNDTAHPENETQGD